MPAEGQKANKGRVRSRNFTADEEEELMRLAKKYWSIIQCKKTDSGNNLKKKETWERIAEEFNANSKGGVARTVESLKTRLGNILQQAKKKNADGKKTITGTGGGPPGRNVNRNISYSEGSALQLLGKRATGLEAEFCEDGDNPPDFDDDDAANDMLEDDEYVVLGNDEVVPVRTELTKRSMKETLQSGSEDIFNIRIEDIEVIDEDPEKEKNGTAAAANAAVPADANWSKYTPDMLQKRKSDALTFSETPCRGEGPKESESLGSHSKRRKVFEDKLAQWAKEKVHHAELQEDMVRAETAAKKQVLECKIQRELTLTDLLVQEVKDRIKYQAEKHAAEMNLIALQKTQLLNNI